MASPLLEGVLAHWRDPLYRNGYLLMLNSLVGAAFGFAFWLIVARVFDEEGALGYAAAVVSAMTLVALVGKLGLDAALIRYVPRSSRGARTRLVAFTSGVAGAAALALGLLFLLLVPRVVSDLRGLSGDAVAGFVFLTGAVVIALGWVLDGYFIAERRAQYSLYRNLVFNLVKITLPVLPLFQASALGIPAAWTAGIVASLVAAGALALASLRRAEPRGGSVPGRREILRYSSLNAAQNVADFLPGLVLPIAVLHVLGREGNAYFYIAWNVAFIAFLASKSIAQSTFAEMTHDQGRVGRHLRKAALQNALVLVPFIAFVVLLGRPLLGLFGPSYAGNAFPLLLLLAFSSGFVAVNALYITFLKARRANLELVLLPAATVAVTFAAGWPLLEEAGLVGLGVGWLLANAVVALWSGWRLRSGALRFEDEKHVVAAAPVGDSPH